MIGIDAGTTFIKSIDVSSGNTFISPNLQYEYGTDIISRISNSLKSDEDYKNCSDLLIQSINNHISKYLKKDEKIVIIGNSVIEHFFLGLDIRSLSKAPFKRVKYEENLNNSTVFLKGFGSFVGSDVLPLIRKMRESKEKYILGLDFGTNCEILLKVENNIYVISSPAGPAFENLDNQKAGKIVDVNISGVLLPYVDDNNVDIKYILPSALIKSIYFYLKSGVIDCKGYLKNKIFIGKYQLENQKIREFQKAKAAVSASWKLLKETYLKDKHIQKMYVCGNMIDENILMYMKKMNIIPDIEGEYIKDSAFDFFRYLFDKEDTIEEKLRVLREKVYFIPHYNLPGFEKKYIDELNFGEIR